MKKTTRSIFICAAFCALAAHAAEPTGNAEVIKLLEASMPESVVIGSIEKSSPRFDTSAAALIRLKDKGATPAILNAILNSGQAKKAGSAATVSKAASADRNPEVVNMLVDGRETSMQYIIPQQRSGLRALGFGGVAIYAQLGGQHAQLKIATGTPDFIVSVPKNAQPQNYLTLANFKVEKNAREVLIGGGYLSYSTGITKDRVRPIKIVVQDDQSLAREGFVLVKVTPEAALTAGEYALVLYTGEVRSAGYFSQPSNSYFDFTVE
jgi:hypothetical protein